MKTKIYFVGLAMFLLISVAGCTGGTSAPAPDAPDAQKFIEDVNATITRLGQESGQAAWVAANFITEDTEAMNARASQRFIDAVAKFAKDAVKYDNAEVTPEVRRQLNVLKVGLTMVTPSNPKEGEELTNLAAKLDATYGKGKWCEDPVSGANASPAGRSDQKMPAAACLDINAITNIMRDSRDEKKLRQVWEGWHTISPPMKDDYKRFVELSNKGAKEMGFTDTGAMWRSKYDMAPEEFTKELDRLWEQVRPLYLSLHAYTRMKLREKYGDVVPANGPIPAHLLGNIWAQDWSNVYSFVAPSNADQGYNLTDILKKRKTTPVDMVKMGERFYTSIGFEPLPQTFWDRSLFTKPRDRDVICHASAWDVDNEDDLRIKMCIEANDEDFNTIHHELGHNFYQRAYKQQPVILRDSANDGFHEAIGDTIALSVTPEYLVKIGLLDTAPDASRDIGLLMSRALEKVAFLPFGLLIDQWRWKVFSGEVTPENYNKAWWDLRLKYQGVAPVTPRGEEFFDPGAKYHVPGNVPYTRYFLAHILQFQFHRELSEIAGCKTALHRCSIYESKDAGQRLNAMLAMGQSRPWPEALETLTGSKQMDATAIIDYFKPLKDWLDEQVKGKPVGW
jgi:peptidyl-dipeptidase A